MDKFLHVGPKRRAAEQGELPYTSVPKVAKTRKYDDAYIGMGFTSTLVGGEERPQCVLCMTVLAAESLKPNKLKCHLDTTHPDCKDKPVEFFRQKLLKFRAQRTTFTKFASVTANAQLASYKISYLLAQTKKPHTDAEEVILPGAIEMVRAMGDEAIVNKLKTIPLSNNTVGRRIHDMAEDIEEQLTDRVCASTRFALQVDEATDSNRDCLLITYIRFIDAEDNDMREDLLFCKQLKTRGTADELFRVIDAYLREANLKWECCLGVCTDGAQAMAGKRSGLQALIKRVSPNVQWTHCMIHREALASKQLSPELNGVMTDVIATVNYIKTRPVKARLFSVLCEEMGSKHTAVLSRVFELREEIRIFLEEEGHALVLRYNNEQFLLALAYLSDIFQKLNELNLQMQGRSTHLPQLAAKMQSFTKKLELWGQRIEEGDTDSFQNLHSFLGNTSCQNTILPCIQSHISALQQHFHKYFPATDAVAHYEWLTDPFSGKTPAHLSVAEQEKFIDVTSDIGLKQQFRAKSLPAFWIGVEKDYPLLGGKAVSILLPFATSYLCEAGFSAVASIKNKYRARLDIESELRVAISQLSPRFEKLCAEKQAHPSH
ncbi:zinc finger BED domain-containing protein 5-like [Neoarius graeffei]|uniref:zinc finger BED domain-containing protein 5-like n=1 Tax=Neoarius graeffei TaxID=443677 RepID=UPI00298C0F5B|nr:zinc finger BED domain-containing protein 5-like [Neoarius graeffei]